MAFRFANYLAKTFYLDLRSLSLLRIGMGFFSAWRIIDIWPYIHISFGTQDFLPVNIAKDSLTWNLFFLVDSLNFVYGLLIICFLASLCLMFGLFTRISCIICYLIVVATVNRFPLMRIGDDSILCVMLFWCIFLPLDHFWSVHKPRCNERTNITASIASMALILQIILIYIVAGYCKSSSIWIKYGTALYYVFANPEYANPLSSWLVKFPWVYKFGTFFTLFIECIVTFLLFIPSAIARSICIVMYFLLHIGIALTMSLEWFPYFMLVVWCALIPSNWWDRKYPAFIPLKWKSPGNFLLILCIVYSAYLGYRHLHVCLFKQKRLPSYFVDLGYTLQITQNWAFFATHPPIATNNFTFFPIFEPSEKPNIFKKSSFNPTLDNFQKFRWVVILKDVVSYNSQDIKDGLISYLTYLWNKEHPNGPRAISFQIYLKQCHLAKKPKVWKIKQTIWKSSKDIEKTNAAQPKEQTPHAGAGG